MGESAPKDGSVAGVGTVMTGDQEEFDEVGRLAITKLKEPEIAGKLAFASDLQGSCPDMFEEDWR